MKSCTQKVLVNKSYKSMHQLLAPADGNSCTDY